MLARLVGAWALALSLLCARAGCETLVVGSSDGSCPNAVARRIQSALDAAVPGSTVIVCAGTYTEQLLVTKPVTLRALPGVRLRPGRLTATTTSLRSGRPVAAAITVGARAAIEGFDVDLAENGVVPCDGTEPLLAALFVRAPGVAIRGNALRGARIDGAPAGCQNGVGLLAQASGGTLRIEGNTVSTYQRGGIVIDAPGTRARVRKNVVTGDGDTPDRTQVGIEISTGALARVDENVVRDHAGPSGTACDLDVGIALMAPRARARANQLHGNVVGIHAAARGHRLADDSVDGGGVGLVGLWLAGDETRVTRPTLHDHVVAGVLVDGNRNALRSATVSAVRADTGCGRPAGAGCAPALDRCGIGLWLRGAGNRATATATVDVDAAVADDGRANLVR